MTGTGARDASNVGPSAPQTRALRCLALRRRAASSYTCRFQCRSSLTGKSVRAVRAAALLAPERRARTMSRATSRGWRRARCSASNDRRLPRSARIDACATPASSRSSASASPSPVAKDAGTLATSASRSAASASSNSIGDPEGAAIRLGRRRAPRQATPPVPRRHRRARPAAEHEPFEQRVAGQPVRAMDAGAGDLTGREQARQRSCGRRDRSRRHP